MMNGKIIYAILGPGISGKGARDLLVSQNQSFICIGDKEPNLWGDDFLKNSKGLGKCFKYGDEDLDEYLPDLEVLILSPGIPRTHKLVRWFIKNKKQVVNEIDFSFASISKGKIVGVTGSNGKTTTVSFIAHALELTGAKVFLGGNIGSPLSSYLSNGEEADFYVLELSSFQLETLSSIKFDVSSFLNFSSTHEERYEKLNDYFSAKMNLKKLTKNEDDFILGPQVISFIKGSPNEKVEVKSFSLSKWKLKGYHNIENLFLAIKILKKLNVKDTAIQKAIDTFTGPALRVEFIDTVDGCSFYNDSKSTNFSSTKAAVSSFSGEELTLLVGGKLRDPSKLPIEKWKNLFSTVDNIIFFGDVGEYLIRNFKDDKFHFYKSLKDLKLDKIESKNILFSPGFPSFDEFQSYVERGDLFNRLILDLKKKRLK